MVFEWTLPEWSDTAGWILLGSVVMFFGSLALLPVIIVKMPADYFTRSEDKSPTAAGRGVGRLLLRVLKNVVGLLLAVLGLVMIFTPGQGLMALFVGVSLLDIPGKRRAEIAILGRPGVLRPINRLRKRMGKAPLEMPPARSRRRK